MGKRQDAALETRQKLIDAMKRLLKEKNADKISIEEITAGAGVAKGTFYIYFKRKEDVISVIALECYKVIKEKALSSYGSVCERLSAYLRGSAEVIEENTLRIAQSWMKSVTAPLPDEQGGVNKYKFDYDIISEMLEKAVSAGELKEDTPVERLTESIIDSYYGAVACWCITNGEYGLSCGIENFCVYMLEPMINSFHTNT